MFWQLRKRSRPFPDFPPVGTEFSAGIGYGKAVDDEHLEQALNAPANAAALVGTGNGEDSTPEDRYRRIVSISGLAFCSGRRDFARRCFL